MNGSEKQIKWAMEKIEAAKITNNQRLQDEELRYAADVAGGFASSIERLEVRRALHKIIDEGLSQLAISGNAGDIINKGIVKASFLVGRMNEVPHQEWIRENFTTANQLRNWL